MSNFSYQPFGPINRLKKSPEIYYINDIKII